MVAGVASGDPSGIGSVEEAPLVGGAAEEELAPNSAVDAARAIGGALPPACPAGPVAACPPVGVCAISALACAAANLNASR